MQIEELRSSGNNIQDAPCRHIAGDDAVLKLGAFAAYLAGTGRICPRPWCWRRFCILFRPAEEPPWLSSWWTTSAQEKQAVFLKQMEYLARHTSRFHEACRFLYGLGEEHWLFAR